MPMANRPCNTVSVGAWPQLPGLQSNDRQFEDEPTSSSIRGRLVRERDATGDPWQCRQRPLLKPTLPKPQGTVPAKAHPSLPMHCRRGSA